MSSKSFDGKREVTGILLFFLGVAMILMFYLPSDFTGTVGSFVKSMGFGLLGITAYSIPLLLVYMGIDYFIEKREGVSKIRVRSVLMLIVCISAFLALITMDFDRFQTLCVDEQGYVTATKALALLWNSGLDSSLISDPANSSNCLAGGFLGGGIAVALHTVLGPIISTIAVVVFFIAQLILVFHVSIKTTAKKTAQAIKTGTNKVYQNVNRVRTERAEKPQGGYFTEFAGQSPFVNNNTRVNVGVNTGVQKVEYDPFNTKIPVDGKSGFIDVSAKEFGADTTPHPDTLNYGEKSYHVPEEENKADFSYTPLPKNPPLHKKGKMEVPSFLDNRQQDFFDLSDGSQPVAPEDDRLPYEVTSNANTTIRRPRVNADIIDDDPVVTENYVPTPAPVPTPSPAAAPEQPAVAINRNTNPEGFSATEGRIIDTSRAENNASVDIPAARKASARKLAAYKAAPAKLLTADEKSSSSANTNNELRAKASTLEQALKSFGIDAQVVNITHGPAITRFELTLATGTKVNRVLSLQDDIQMAMAAYSVRIEAPIPGKSAIGIEIPNDKTQAVHLRGLIEDPKFRNSTPLTVALGRDIPGKPIFCDLAKMPHLLIAGQTGSGKSVCINTILCSILCKSSPDDVRLIMVDPKVVELSVYNGIPHLIMPVVTEAKKVSNLLKWAVVEMERRYRLFSESNVRNLEGYNEYLKYNGEKPLPLILIIVDELADLMTVAGKDVETQISRLAAKARAAGLHLIIATQRPSVDVITGVIKANLPSRIAFSVASSVDSRTILDQIGAEKLLGKGDMLYYPGTANKPIRGQGAFVSDKEVETIVDYLKNNYGSMYDQDIIETVNSGVGDSGDGGSGDNAVGGGNAEDDLFEQAVDVVIEAGSASSSILQRRLGVGYPRASRLIDLLERKGIIGPFEGSKPRKVLITQIDWLEMKAKGGK
ncbi:MAG: hypothetical protein J6Z43_00650 [Clostridiales bacterium]|nr:hypothetical protein [Clostridiales bacterium]